MVELAMMVEMAITVEMAILVETAVLVEMAIMVEIAILVETVIMVDFPLGAQNCERIRKPKFHVFWLFTPLFGRFRLSRIFQTTGFEEIYRLI